MEMDRDNSEVNDRPLRQPRISRRRHLMGSPIDLTRAENWRRTKRANTSSLNACTSTSPTDVSLSSAVYCQAVVVVH